MSHYRIVQHTYQDPINQPDRYGDKFFTIQHRRVTISSIVKRLTGKIKKWSDWECIIDPYRTYQPLKFKTYKQALDTLKKLSTGQVVKGWKETVIKEFEIETHE